MKKILVLLFIGLVGAFSSPLFAVDGSPPGIKVQKFTGENVKNVGLSHSEIDGRSVHTDDVTYVGVYILNKHTLMYSFHKQGKLGIECFGASCYKKVALSALVSHLRGEGGV